MTDAATAVAAPEDQQKSRVARVILQQLGGQRFIAMTGAHTLTSHRDALTFRLPQAEKGINYVRITLTSSDLYRLEFRRVQLGKFDPKRMERKPDINKLIEEIDGIYYDSLQDVFRRVTGLATRL